jgi:hypothetical protein
VYAVYYIENPRKYVKSVTVVLLKSPLGPEKKKKEEKSPQAQHNYTQLLSSQHLMLILKCSIQKYLSATK